MTGVTGTTAADRDATRVPVHRLTVLYDAGCPLCRHVRDWLARQRQLVPLDLVPAGSDEARRRLPELDHGRTLEEITVVGDGGQVYRGPAAWIVCLWALADHRPTAHRLSTPVGAPLARAAVLAAARYRRATRRPEGDGAWGGRVYRTSDGWTYDPDAGWTRTGQAPPPALPPACGGTCPAPD
ncbi:thiol-disulfide oxidoreductase DCC family protein [Streptomyces sp. DH37]|uniref:thiol-disulfide oxidoreductase DCC family protein n=1 Tax=Streptomyces sp. DH37 TaxID=3040122 RepID=UPI0024431411|nr:DCC1-like thiol-disulfide oxidoreductase family protein [Streptomyces sp. DH37]MDG9700758.1 DCC1-like thiol-disulfide oxidoreductase family protein [Streptomyces sp. DH37]